MPLYLLFLTFFIAHNKNENDGIHTSSVEDRSQDKHVFSEIFEIQYRSQQLYLEKKFFLEAENSVSNAFWLFKLVNYKTLIFLPIFPTKLDCFQCIPPVGRAGVANCTYVLSRCQKTHSDLEISTLAFAGMAFSGSFNVPLQICWNASSLLGLL